MHGPRKNMTDDERHRAYNEYQTIMVKKHGSVMFVILKWSILVEQNILKPKSIVETISNSWSVILVI